MGVRVLGGGGGLRLVGDLGGRGLRGWWDRVWGGGLGVLRGSPVGAGFGGGLGMGVM